MWTSFLPVSWHMFIHFELISIYANIYFWVLAKLRFAELLKSFSILYVIHIKKHTPSPCPKSSNFSLLSHTVFKIQFNIIHSRIRSVCQLELFVWISQSTVRSTHPTNLILLHFTTSKHSGEQYKLWSSSICHFLHPLLLCHTWVKIPPSSILSRCCLRPAGCFVHVCIGKIVIPAFMWFMKD